MANTLRLIFGIFLLPACWGFCSALVRCIIRAADRSGGFNLESIALLGGVLLFSLCWALLPHPVKTYVVGHELTHALWGLLFGAKPSNLKIGKNGGSVNLTKTNFFITLAPYFFPFYTFIVLIAAFITYLFVRPLPLLPLWVFLIGFTWAFHLLFTMQTLTEKQPDIKVYGRIFSWAFILMANITLLLLWLAFTTGIGLPAVLGILLEKVLGAYAGIWNLGAALFSGLFSGGGK
jgi:hypothetical protein